VVQALEGLEGVKRATTSYPEKSAVVVYDTASVTLEQMKNALQGVGYFVSFSEHAKQNTLKQASMKDSEFQRDELACIDPKCCDLQ
jgi:copper chaperone CopZ